MPGAFSIRRWAPHHLLSPAVRDGALFVSEPVPPVRVIMKSYSWLNTEARECCAQVTLAMLDLRQASLKAKYKITHPRRRGWVMIGQMDVQTAALI